MDTDRREEPRVKLRSPIEVIPIDEFRTQERPQVKHLGWTMDISTAGIRLVTTQPIVTNRVWIRFLCGTSQLVASKIVRVETERTFARDERELYVYGAQFDVKLSITELCHLVCREEPTGISKLLA